MCSNTLLILAIALKLRVQVKTYCATCWMSTTLKFWALKL